MPERKLLDTKTLETVEDINKVDFSKFTDDTFKSWVRHIVYPVAQNELDRLCKLAMDTRCNVMLQNNMGDLYFKERK